MVGEERAYLGGAITCEFQTRYGFCFFQLHSRYEKAEPVPGSFHASIFPYVGSLRSPTWGFQKHNSYRVAFSSLACYLAIWSSWWNNRVEITTQYGINRMLIWGILRRKVTQVARWFESKNSVIYVKLPCKQILGALIGDKSLLLNSFNCLSRMEGIYPCIHVTTYAWNAIYYYHSRVFIHVFT